MHLRDDAAALDIALDCRLGPQRPAPLDSVTPLLGRFLIHAEQIVFGGTAQAEPRADRVGHGLIKHPRDPARILNEVRRARDSRFPHLVDIVLDRAQRGVPLRADAI